MNLSQYMTKKVGLTLLGMAIAVPVVVMAGSVEERIAPVGEVCMAGDACAAAVVASAGGEPRSGEQVYTTKCFTCHATGAAGAPKLGDTADWNARLSDRDVAGLYANAVNGFAGMPAKGLCMDCSDEEIHAAVDHMLENSQ